MAGSWTRALGVSAALLCAPALDAGSLDWRQSSPGNFDYGRQLTLPAGFGTGEFTLEVWIRPNNNFPTGSTAGGGQLTNWSTEDFSPYSSGGWWFNGNFLLDGHNNAGSNFQNGTFSVQLYGGGRVRWLFGDGASGGLAGDLWAVQASQTSSAPSMLDGAWHHLALVRRFSGGSQSTLELWIDGALIDTETSSARTNMATSYWNNWTGFPSGQQGWFWGVEKQAALGSTWEDYKGLIDELRFWSRAKTTTELGTTWRSAVTGSETGLVGWYDFSDGSGTSTCSAIVTSQCMTLINTAANVWNADEAPTTGGGEDTTAPSVPQSLAATPTSSTAIDLNWNASTDNSGGSGVASYRVQRDGATIAGNVAGTSFSDSGLTANTLYSYTVSAIDVAGNRSAESAAAQATTPAAPADTTPPSMPGSFTATPTSATSISLSWSASTDNVAVTGYRVRRAGNASVIANPTGLSFVDSGRTPTTTYNYTVTAIDAAGNESATATASATTPADTTPPSAPGAFTATATSATSISLSWSAAADNVAVTGYRVRRVGNTTVIASPVGLSFVDAGRAPSTTYSYTVTAVDAAGNESATATASATTPADTTAPGAPGSFTATATSPTSISLSWSAPTDNVGVTGYQVRRGGTLIASPTGLSFVDSGRTPSTLYNYTVTALDAAGNASAPASASATTQADTAPPSAPGTFTAAATSPTSISLSWSASTDNVGVTGYRVRRDGGLIASPTGLRSSDNSRTPSTTYNYTVTALDAAGNESAAAAASATTPAPPPDVIPPTVPGNLQALATSTTTISLTWNASSDNVAVASYRVQRGGVTVAASVTGTTFSDVGLAPNTSYSYTVSAVDAATNRSAESNTAQATTLSIPDTIAPTVPANVVATPTSATTVDLTWSASTDNVAVTTYRVRRGGVTVAANVAGTSFADTNLTPSTNYSYTVSAVDGAGNRSAESTAALATTPAAVDTTAPTVPANLSATAASSTVVNLTWSASSDSVGVTSYRVQRDGVAIANSVVGTSYSDTGLTPNTAYSYTVSAVDAAGNRSLESTADPVTTPAAPGSSSGSPARSGGRLDLLTLLAGLAALWIRARRRGTLRADRAA